MIFAEIEGRGQQKYTTNLEEHCSKWLCEALVICLRA